jgi:hypothetical protein
LSRNRAACNWSMIVSGMRRVIAVTQVRLPACGVFVVLETPCGDPDFVGSAGGCGVV